MPSACTAFIDLSVGQTIAILVMTLAAIALAFLLGKDEGREAARRELRQQASKDAANRLGLLDDVDRHQVGGRQ